MRLSFPDQKSAQAVADRLYADMKAANKLEPLTTAWAIPYQDTDKDGKPIGTDWYIVVDNRCVDKMTTTEKLSVPELSVQLVKA